MSKAFSEITENVAPEDTTEATWFETCLAVNDFAKLMLQKLWHHRTKGGPNVWRHDSFHELLNRLDDEYAELEEALMEVKAKDRDSIIAAQKECADVGNFAMMIMDKLTYMLDQIEPQEREDDSNSVPTIYDTSNSTV